MRRLNDAMYVRSWQYVAVSPGGWRSGPHFINENLTGAALGMQRPARITFQTALWVIKGWNLIGGASYRLIVPILKD